MKSSDSFEIIELCLYVEDKSIVLINFIVNLKLQYETYSSSGLGADRGYGTVHSLY